MLENPVLGKLKKLLNTDSIIEFYRPLDKNYLVSIIEKDNNIIHRLEQSKWIARYEKKGFYFNFDPIQSFWMQCLKEYQVISTDHNHSLQCTDTTSFNPTGLPHVGNWQIFSEGGCLKRIKELVYKGLRIDSIYMVNDHGGQINKIHWALNHNEPLEGYDIEDMRRIRSQWTVVEITDHILDKIKREIHLFDSMRHTYLYESHLGNERSKMLEMIKDLLMREGKALYVPYKDDKIFLTKSDGDYTYLLSDMAFQYKLSKTYHKNTLLLGADHRTHSEHLIHLLSLIGLENFLTIVHIGKLKIWDEEQEQITYLSKRKAVDIPHLEKYNIRVKKLGLFVVRKHKNNIWSSSFARDFKMKITNIIVSFFRVRYRINYISFSARIQEHLVIILSKLPTYLAVCAQMNDTSYLSLYCVQLAKQINASGRNPWNYPLWLRLRQSSLIIKRLIDV